MKENNLLFDGFEQTQQQLFEEFPYGEPEEEILYDWNGGIANEGK